MSTPAARFTPTEEFRLGDLRVSPDADLLRRGGDEIRLQPQVMRLLVYLAERAGQVVTREEILERVWDDRFVSDAVLTTAVWELRSALGDDAKDPRYLETIPKRGYRLLVNPTGAGATRPALPTARWLGWALFVAVVAAAVVAWAAGTRWLPGPRPADGLHTLAVLPIDNLSGDPGQDYLTIGLTDTLITELARFSELRVTSRTSVMSYAVERPMVPEIARQLAVDSVIEGAMVRAGDRIRLTVQLIDARTDHHVWAESYERPVDDIIALQNELARVVAGEIKLHMTPEEERLTDRSAGPSPAVDDYLRGLALLIGEPYDADRAIASFEAAIAIDPDFAPAHAHLALAYVWAAWDYTRAPHSIMERAREAARTALELDPTLARAHFALANVSDLYDWDWAAAEERYRQAIRFDPSDAITRRTLAQFLAEHGRFDEALEEAEAAQACDPRSPASPRTLGWIHYLARRTPEALSFYREAASMAPPSIGLRQELALILTENGDTKSARAELEALDAEDPENFLTLALLVMSSARAGDLEPARADLERLLAAAARSPAAPTAIAKAYAWLGEVDEAFEWLERAVVERAPSLIRLRVDPQFDALRGDGRLEALMARIETASSASTSPRQAP